MRSKIFIISILVSLFSFKSFGNYSQLEKIDSLYNVSWEYLYLDTDSSLYFSDKLMEFSLRSENWLGVLKSYYATGYAYFLQNKFDKALINYFAGIEIIKNENLVSSIYRERELRFLQNIGLIYELTYGYSTANEYYSKALKIAESLESLKGVAVLNYNLGVVNHDIANLQKAEKYYHKALSSYQQLNNKEGIAKTYNLFGILYKDQGQFEKANTSFFNAINLCENFKILEKEKAWFISNLGETCFVQGKFDSAIYYYNKALLISQELDDVDKIKWLNNNLGDVYYEKGEYYISIECYLKAFEYGDNRLIDVEYKRASKNLALAYEKINSLEKSIEYHKIFISQAELLQSTKNNLQEQNAQYRMKEVEWMLEKQMKEQQLQNIEKVNFWFKVSMSLLVLVLAAAAYKAYRYYSGVKAVKKWLASDY